LEIVTFPVGLLIGLFPVIVDLEGHAGIARLRLDGAPVCEVSARAPACMVDLGPDPRVHTLDLERLDENGKVVESIRRWINRPTAIGKIRAVGSCDEKKRQCEFHVQWAHPGKLTPSSVSLALDGKKVAEGLKPVIRVPFPKSKPPQILTVDADFPDGQRADFTQLLHGSYPEEAEASLHPVNVELVSPQDASGLAERLRGAGWKVRAIEEGDAEILFVLQPKAISRYAPSALEIAQNAMIYGGSLEGQGQLWFLPADESLALLRPSAVGERIEHWLAGMISMTSRASLGRVRIADAVAAAGYRLGAVPRRRIIVLVLGADDVPQPDDASTLSPAQALDFLRESGVPLIVWRVAMNPKKSRSNAGEKWPEWPEGDWVRGTRDFPRAIAHLREVMDRQRITWIEDAVELDALESRLPPGIALAGRVKPAAGPQPAPPLASSPPDSRTVYSVAFDPRQPESVYAGTAEGLLHSSDRGRTWGRVETGAPGGIFTLAFIGEGQARLFAGAGAGLVTGAAGVPRWSTLDLPAVTALAEDPSNPSVLYAGGQGRILRSVDSGARWSEVSGEIASFALDLAVDPNDPSTVYAGTAGSGVFKSRNQGKTWSPAGPELQNTAVRCLALDPRRPGTLYAGTDGGVFRSANAGGNWKLVGAGLPRAVTYALAADGSKDRIYAGTAAGLFVSETGGRSWKRFAALKAIVSSLALDPGGDTIAAGTLGEGVAVLRVADVEAQIAKVRAGWLQALPGSPESLLPPTADGPEVPLDVEVTGARRAKDGVTARLDATVHLDAVREAIAEKGSVRVRLIVAADAPAMSRVDAGGVEQTLPFDGSVTTWKLGVPVRWPVRATRLIVAVIEEQTGAHAIVTLDAPKPQ
jgi:photosystem II stability/assembly factor-like uncharacterized protein